MAQLVKNARKQGTRSIAKNTPKESMKKNLHINTLSNLKCLSVIVAANQNAKVVGSLIFVH